MYFDSLHTEKGMIYGDISIPSGFKLAQKFRGKIGRSFIGQERSYNYRPGLVFNICSNKYTSI